MNTLKTFSVGETKTRVESQKDEETRALRTKYLMKGDSPA